MTARHQLPGAGWLLWVRSVALRTGIVTGIYLSCTFVAWLLMANRVRQLEPFAGPRNFIAGALMVAWLCIPIVRFRHEPASMLISGLAAWTLLSFTYLGAEMFFTLLESRIGALHLFILGGISYGFVAVFVWVFLLCVLARQEHISHTRHVSPSAGRPRTR